MERNKMVVNTAMGELAIRFTKSRGLSEPLWGSIGGKKDEDSYKQDLSCWHLQFVFLKSFQQQQQQQQQQQT